MNLELKQLSQVQTPLKNNKVPTKFQRKQVIEKVSRKCVQANTVFLENISYISPRKFIHQSQASNKQQQSTLFYSNHSQSRAFTQRQQLPIIKKCSSIFKQQLQNKKESPNNINDKQKETKKQKNCQDHEAYEIKINNLNNIINYLNKMNAQKIQKIQRYHELQQYLMERQIFVGQLLERNAELTKQVSSLTKSKNVYEKQYNRLRSTLADTQTKHNQQIQAFNQKYDTSCNQTVVLANKIHKLEQMLNSKNSKIRQLEDQLKLWSNCIQNTDKLSYIQNSFGEIQQLFDIISNLDHEELQKQCKTGRNNILTTKPRSKETKIEQVSAVNSTSHGQIAACDCWLKINSLNQQIKYLCVQADMLRMRKEQIKKTEDENSRLKKANRKLIYRLSQCLQNKQNRKTRQYRVSSCESLELSLSPGKERTIQ